MHVILQVMESFSKLQVNYENDAHSPQFHIYLVFCLILDGNGTQKSCQCSLKDCQLHHLKRK